MKVIFCAPQLSMEELESATDFFNECKKLLDTYVANVQYVLTSFQINQLMSEEADSNDILVFLHLIRENMMIGF